MYSFFIAVKSYNFFMYVYIEYAILDNLIINYLLIKSACACAKVKTKFILLFLSSLLGTIIAIVLPILNLSNESALIIKILLSFLMPLISSKFLSFKSYFLTFIFFILFTFLCGGFIIAIFNFSGVDYEIYYSLNYDSPIPIGITVFLVYIITKLLKKLVFYLIKERNVGSFMRRCVLIVNKTKYQVYGFIDSGNSLYDTNSGLPVIVASKNLFDKIQKNGIKKSVSTIEFSTVNGKSLMELYVIDKLMIYNGEKVNIFNNVLLGATNFSFNSKEFELLLHPSLQEN